MIEHEFKKLASTYDCNFHISEDKVSGEAGSYLKITIYSIKIPYLKSIINISYEFGNHNMAKFETTITTKNPIPEIELTTRSHFSRLLRSKENLWMTQCKNKAVEKTLFNNLKTTGLTKLAQQEAFEPIIKGDYKNDIYNFSTSFYLGFNNKEESMEPVVEFYKKMLEYLYTNYGSHNL